MKKLIILLFFAFMQVVYSQNTALEIEWAKCYGGSDRDYAYSIQQISDGGYNIAGSSDSKVGDVTNHGKSDCWIVKFKAEGTDVDETNTKNNSGFSISPNPVIDNLTITISESLIDESIQIYNLTGIKVLQVNINNTTIQIELESLPQGVYFIKIGNETKMFVKK
jgi:hypothetical protein